MFLQNQGLSLSTSLFYSISVALLAYPSSGVPFSDHHSILLSFIAIYFLIFAIKSNKNIYWLAIPFILFTAFLCKQVPAAFFIVLVFFYILGHSIKNKDYYKFIPIIISSSFSLLSLFLFLIFNNIEIKSFLIQYIYFPITIGDERSSILNFNDLISILITDLKFFSFLIIIFIFFLVRDLKFNNSKIQKFFQTEFIILLATLVAIFNQILMKNQNIIFFILPIMLGVIHTNVFKTYNKKKIFLILVIILNIFITTKYHFRFNVDRKFMDLENVDKSKSINAMEISSKLKGLKWISTKTTINKFSEVELLKASLKFLQENKSNSLIITDYQFILSELNHKFYPPNRWYTTDGVSYPLSDNKYFYYYKEFFKEKINKYDVKTIFTMGSIDYKSFNFILKENCIKTTKINDILFEHKLLNCL